MERRSGKLLRSKRKSLNKKVEEKGRSYKKVSPLILILLAVTLALAAGLYFYVEFTDFPVKKANVQVFDVENSEFKDFLHAGRIARETFFGVVITEKWNVMTDEERKELIREILALGKQEGFRKVALIDKNGITVGTGAGETVQIQDKQTSRK